MAAFRDFRLVISSLLWFSHSAAEGSALARILATCAGDGIDVYFIDRTRPEFGVPVVRAIAPGLCNDKPRWGWARLLAADPNDTDTLCVREGYRPPNAVPLRV